MRVEEIKAEEITTTAQQLLSLFCVEQGRSITVTNAQGYGGGSMYIDLPSSWEKHTGLIQDPDDPKNPGLEGEWYQSPIPFIRLCRYPGTNGGEYRPSCLTLELTGEEDPQKDREQYLLLQAKDLRPKDRIVQAGAWYHVMSLKKEKEERPVGSYPSDERMHVEVSYAWRIIHFPVLPLQFCSISLPVDLDLLVNRPASYTWDQKWSFE